MNPYMDQTVRIAGRRAYGWNYDMTEHVPEEVARIHEAAERVLASESVWSICTDWNAQGVATVTGRPWTVTTITSILTSGRIAGLREHKGVVVAKGQWEFQIFGKGSKSAADQMWVARYILTRLTVLGAAYLSAVCILPEILISEYSVPFYFGGTSLLICVTVTMDTVAQIHSHLIAHQYEGLMKKTKLRGRRG